MHKLLLIEDYPVIQQMYNQVLAEKGFDVDLASDGKDALEKIKQTKYDVILVDLLLPEVNGIEFLKQFKERGKTKIVVLSDFDHKETVKEAYALGIDKYWLKVENTPHLLAERLTELLKKDQGTPPPADK